VINLLVELQKELKLSYLFISHNLSVVGYISHRVAVMYKGRIVELADAPALFENPLHPYTGCLMDAVPEARPRKSPAFRPQRRGGDQDSSGLSSGCAYRAWCPRAGGICAQEPPLLQEKGKGHFVACHLADPQG